MDRVTELTGARAHHAPGALGGLNRDLPDGLGAEGLQDASTRIDELTDEIDGAAHQATASSSTA